MGRVSPESGLYDVKRLDRLRALGTFGGVGVTLSALYAATGVGIPCPSRVLLGWRCPLCGGTHVGASLLRGDLAAAWSSNPLLVVVLAALAAYATLLLVGLARPTALRVVEAIDRVLGRLPRWSRWTVLVTVAVVYTAARTLG